MNGKVEGISRVEPPKDTSEGSSTAAGMPEFPVPDFDGVTVAFGANLKDYLTREQLGDWYGLYGANSNSTYHKAVEGLFYQGGSLADFGLKWKPNIDPVRAMSAVRALLRSFAPKHEIKIGTVAYALSQWCDPTSEVA